MPVSEYVEAAETTQNQGANTAMAKAIWRAQAEQEGAVRVLQWSGIGFATATWRNKFAVLHRGQLHILEGDSMAGTEQTFTVYIDR